MPRKRNPIPKLCRHKATDRGYARVDGRHVNFGKWGTDEAVERYRRLVAEHASGTNEPAPRRDEFEEELTVAGLVVRYWRFIENSGRYTKNGEPTSERERVRGALDELLALYASDAGLGVRPAEARRSAGGDDDGADWAASFASHGERASTMPTLLTARR